ncbi:AAA family ATPase [Limnothrix sp. FACHB-1083]|uniref:trifunctional serine/threonine-protein kinase/ATP-binding protein/sensor histidine kinase n=1 Tax=unclassified Limnothrix TaxID=2632864 RepID=UPI0016800B46|nr:MULTISPECIES: ATP-binding sensor histidine kinase [unclassified Limnothrix]MBD2162256.1 AAA family ATPase [Limnothrix sp. FACHB-1083]MBD2193187.1 AAA family ATPase [Limnothrix sp. FACHB-1088]
MDVFAQYQISKVLSTTERTIVYRALKQPEQKPVILKTVASDYPNRADLAKLQHEYEVLRDLNLEGVVETYGLDEIQGKPFLVLEDFGGCDLISCLQNQSLSLDDILWIGCQLAAILGRLHNCQIIHKDIKPHNLIFEPKVRQLKLTDFSIASRLSKEHPILSSPNLLEGTLLYVSPEQTGRMNRTVDYRTDFYSLGVTLYELLTGQLPFQSSDPMELVHCHIAKSPIPPHYLNAQIPPQVSAVILKLMAKTAEERYQSAYGIQRDLEECLSQWQRSGSIAPFPLAERDQCGTFSIPQKLYGREMEVQQLLDVFDRVSAGNTEMVLVAGYSGIGKSALVNEVHKPIARQRGYFISGKFDQFQRNIPYASPIQAFRELARQLLTETEEQIAVWRAKLTAALGNNGSIITDVIPELESIVGPQTPAPELPPSEAQNRFNLVFRTFIHVFCQVDRPLVIFLDDLQWADAASLQLIEQLMTDPDGQYLLMLGAYRDNEVDSTHPLLRMLGTIEAEGAKLQTITLKPLTLDHVLTLVGDTLHRPPETVEPIAQLLVQKTQGNPFFLTQLFKYLYVEGVIWFESGTGQWEWSFQHLPPIEITENVISLMVHEIQKLDVSVQRALQLAACIGNQFDLDMLAIVHEKSTAETSTDLWQALQAGLVIPLNAAYKIPQVLEDCKTVTITYKFLHDRVQQAAYSLIPNDEKQLIHLTVGRLLLNSIEPDRLDDCLFDVVNAMNVGSALITDAQEQLLLARLNDRAGSKAKAAAAYNSAQEYFAMGRQLLPENAWDTDYELSLSLYTESVEVEYLLTRFEEAQILSEIALKRSRSLLDRTKIYELKIQFLIAENQMHSAIETALPVLELLGYPLVIDPQLLQLNQPLPELDQLADYPEMSDRAALAALEILIIITGPSYQARPDLLPFIVFRMVNMCLELGHSALAAYAYGMYGLLLCGPLNQIELGYRSGQISLQILEQYPSDALKCKIHMLFNSFVVHWKEPHQNTIQFLERTVQMGMETGDVVYATYCAMWSCGYMMLVGTPLAEVAREQQLYIELLQKIKQDHGLYPAMTWRQLTEALESPETPTSQLEGRYINRQLVSEIQASENQMLLFFIYFAETILAYVMNDWEAAKTKANLADQYQAAATASMLSGGFTFYAALVYLKTTQPSDLAALNEEEQDRPSTLELLTAKLENWAHHAPENYQSKYELVLAETARWQGEILRAMDYYDRAINTAQAHSRWPEVAIAAERAAELYHDSGRDKIAKQYWLDAAHAYDRWGAKAKVAALQAKSLPLQNLSPRRPPTLPPTGTQHSTHPHTTASTVLDINTVIKAAQALSGEIVLSQLLTQLTRLTLENAGAQTGYLLLKDPQQNNRLTVVATSHVEGQTAVDVPLNCPLSPSLSLPVSLIQYVQRTQESVVLGNAMAEGLFTNDPYIANQQIQSVICMPITQQGQLMGVLYLENNLAIDAFTPDRLEVLQILMAQAAISIENARLYRNLEDYSNNLEKKVAARTQELTERNQQLKITLQELQQTQAQLIQAEKMSSLGQMVAGIAHEINNPISFIMGNITHARSYFLDLLDLLALHEQHSSEIHPIVQARMQEMELDFLKEDLNNLFHSMQNGVDRVRQIVLGLRNFSRLDESDQKQVDLHEGIDNTLLILQHRLQVQSQQPAISVLKNYGEIPLVNCYASMVNQVFLNILTNAIDALRSPAGFALQPMPEISIETRKVSDRTVQISITDNGPGMEDSVRQKIFDPFFTTKPVGEGKGLGLSVSYQIITQQHHGQLSCQSAPQQGATLTIELPIDGPA